jgi:hypothetical protein
MCDYPTCKKHSVHTHVCADQALHLCNEHESLYSFIKRVGDFVDWGF